MRSGCSSVSTVTRLWAGRPRIDSRQRQGFSLRHRVQTVSDSNPPSDSGVLGAFSLGVKQPGCETNHSPPSSAEVKNAWAYTSTTPTSSLSGA
jgi:hypothetical protein